jgi:RsiW-degrading membrane proteinase PrsW (M82 family)
MAMSECFMHERCVQTVSPVDCMLSEGKAMRVIVVLMLIGILFSLGSALVFIYRDQGQGKTRAVKALSWRVGLSLALFLLLMLAQRFGWMADRL